MIFTLYTPHASRKQRGLLAAAPARKVEGMHVRQRKRAIRCRVGEKRFTVVRVGSDPLDTYAARSFEQALHLANPDRGDRVEVLAVCALIVPT